MVKKITGVVAKAVTATSSHISSFCIKDGKQSTKMFSIKGINGTENHEKMTFNCHAK